MLRIVVPMLFLLAASHASLSAAETPASLPSDAIPQLNVPAADIERARAALPPRNERDPVRLTVGVPVSLSLADGLWTLEGGQAVWRARVRAAGAPLLVAAFDRFELPAGAQLRFSDVAGSVVQGPYTRAHRAENGTLVTAMVPGEDGLIELRLPSEERDAVDLHLGGLGYGIEDSAGGGIAAKSGSCNVDVACPAGNAWRNQIRSVVYLQIPVGSLGGLVKCTGQLVNNTANVDRPFLLTANHCNASASNAGNITAYFNYQTATCNGARTENPIGFPSQTGMSFRANHARADHTLLELNAVPASSLNVFYSGFNASTTATPASGASIHHPIGHEKRISLYSEAQRVNNQSVGTFTVDAFQVFWDTGVTESGSSGGGLWNQNGQLVGVLSGGASSCAVPDGADYYGRLDLAWDNLGAFLDTSGTGTRSVAGRDGTAVANHPPVAVDDVATTAEDVPLVVTSATLVSNDTDADGHTLTVTAVSNAVNGTVNLASGTITFTPNANFSGSARFDYTVSDGNGGSDTGRVDIDVTPPGGGNGGGGGGGSFGAGLALLAAGLARRAWRARSRPLSDPVHPAPHQRR